MWYWSQVSYSFNSNTIFMKDHFFSTPHKTIAQTWPALIAKLKGSCFRILLIFFPNTVLKQYHLFLSLK
jgi:hypothetical protein